LFVLLLSRLQNMRICNKIIPAKSSSGGDTVVIASFNIYDSKIGFIYEPRQRRPGNIIFVLSVFYFFVHLPAQRPLIKNKQDGLWKYRGVFLFLNLLRIYPNYITTCTWTPVCVCVCVCVGVRVYLWLSAIMSFFKLSAQQTTRQWNILYYARLQPRVDI